VTVRDYIQLGYVRTFRAWALWAPLKSAQMRRDAIDSLLKEETDRARSFNVKGLIELSTLAVSMSHEVKFSAIYPHIFSLIFTYNLSENLTSQTN